MLLFTERVLPLSYDDPQPERLNDAGDTPDAQPANRCSLLASIPSSCWRMWQRTNGFLVPRCSVALAWQMGHLAMAEYGLTCCESGANFPTMREWISNDFIRCFKKGSDPVADASRYPAVAEISQVFERVHEQSLREMDGYPDEELTEPLPAPYAVFPNKLGSLLFCSAHEMLHAGQIGLLRRLLGKAPLR